MLRMSASEAPTPDDVRRAAFSPCLLLVFFPVAQLSSFGAAPGHRFPSSENGMRNRHSERITGPRFCCCHAAALHAVVGGFTVRNPSLQSPKRPLCRQHLHQRPVAHWTTPLKISNTTSLVRITDCWPHL